MKTDGESFEGAEFLLSGKRVNKRSFKKSSHVFIMIFLHRH